MACKNGHIQIVEYLISKSVDIEAKDRNEWTPLHLASRLSYTGIVKYLISKGANKNAKTKDGKTPYDLSIFNETRSILK